MLCVISSFPMRSNLVPLGGNWVLKPAKANPQAVE
jgi:hypothetical protein